MKLLEGRAERACHRKVVWHDVGKLPTRTMRACTLWSPAPSALHFGLQAPRRETFPRLLGAARATSWGALREVLSMVFHC